MREIDEIVEFNYAPGWALVHFANEGPFNTPVRKRDLDCMFSRRKSEKEKEVTVVYNVHLYL